MDEEKILVAVILIMWYLLPAYLANAIAAIVGGGAPVDGGKNWKDGRRILGDGKTWKGLIGGTLGGIITGIIILNIGSPIRGVNSFTEPDNLLALEGYNYVHISAVMSFGALLGDMMASFVKRRMGYQRGKMVLGLDQYDFILVSLALTWLLYGQWIEELFDNHLWREMATILILTPLLHKGVNVIGYKIGVKNEPW